MNANHSPTSANSLPHVKFIDRLWAFTLAVAFVGPLALPLFWRNPRFSYRTKIWVSLAILALTAGLIFLAGNMTLLLLKQIRGLQG